MSKKANTISFFPPVSNSEFKSMLKKRGIKHPSEYVINKRMSENKIKKLFEDCIINAFDQVYSKHKFDFIKISYDFKVQHQVQKLFGGYKIFNEQKFLNNLRVNINLGGCNKRIINFFLEIENILKKNNYFHISSIDNSFFEAGFTKTIPKDYFIIFKINENELTMKSVNFNRFILRELSWFWGSSSLRFSSANGIKDINNGVRFFLDTNYLNAEMSDDILKISEDKKLNTKFVKLSNELINSEILRINDKVKAQKKEIQDSKDTFFEKFDKNNNGKLDILETKSGFSEFIKKYQKDIINEDKKYLQDIVKLSRFLNDQEYNLEKTFSLIKNAKTKTKLSNFKRTFKIQHLSYTITLFESYRLVLSLVQGDLITFYNLYEEFERNRVFETQWQRDLHTTTKELSSIRQLTAINAETLLRISSQIREMELSMIQGFNMVNQTLVEGFESVNQNIQIMNKSLTNELKGINNKLWWNNLFQVVQIYQNRRRYNQLNKLIK